MPLTFPTIAEQVREEFQQAPRTIALATIARKRSVEITRAWPSTTTYWFDDGTSIEVTGRGKAHRIEVRLP